MTSSSFFTSSNSNLNREVSFINLSDIIIGEKVETGSNKSQMTDEEIKQKFAELALKLKQSDKRNDELALRLSQSDRRNEELALKLLESDKKYEELVKKLKEVKACFLKLSNKWTVCIKKKCCANQCVYNNPNTICNIYGFIQITSDTNVKYNCKPNHEAIIIAEKNFKKPVTSKLCLNCAIYTLCYYEIKLKIERSKPVVEIGFINNIYLCLNGGYISYFDTILNKDKFINLSSSFSFNNEDIIGCGVVYPPPNINNNKLPYIFFTKNGELIGKAIEVNGNIQDLFPSVILKYCSIETNFGDNLNSKPFKYDITNHIVAKEFYEDEDFTDE
ncbi:hypothetical protein Mgra_00003430 [Meloidogyne graminicola]|uniref:SPRY domain-containing protein n=1 Tax=Meloidogyne graminicola TaxID=189291 RepID=A0A8S9ZVM8_9BILA|nr:hypothetical protein Mgra_00003430 [Meloidogyne graminicola]